MAQDILITPGSGEPQILFRGSGTNDTPIELNVLSSYQSASSSGSALLFEGTEGQLFAITDNLSSGVIFSVAGAAGLPFIEADASGDVRLIEYGRYVGVGTGTPAYQLDVFGTGRFSEGIMFGDGTTQTTAAGGGGGGSTTGTSQNILFYGGDNNLAESTDLRFDSGNARLYIGNSSNYIESAFGNDLRVTRGGTARYVQFEPFSSYMDIYGYNGRGQLRLYSQTKLSNDATANVLALVNGSNPQEFRIYHSGNGDFPTNYERLSIKATGYNYEISPQVNNGTAGSVVITNDTSSKEILVVKGAASQSANLQEWQSSAGATLAEVDNTGNISGNDIVAANDLTAADTFRLTKPYGIHYIQNGTKMRSSGSSAVSIEWTTGGNMRMNSAYYNSSASWTFNGFQIQAAGTLTNQFYSNGGLRMLDIGNEYYQGQLGLQFTSGTMNGAMNPNAIIRTSGTNTLFMYADDGVKIMNLAEVGVSNTGYTGIGTEYRDLTARTGIFTSGVRFGDGTTQTTAAAGATPGGSDTNIQFNNGGSFSGESTLTWNYDTDALTVSGNTLMAGTGVILDVQTTGGTTLFAVEDTTETTLVVNSQNGQTSHPFEVRDAFGLTAASIDVSGNISGNHLSFGDGTTQTTAATASGPPAVVSDTGTAITMVCNTHADKYLRTTANSAVTITFPSGLGCDANSEFTFEQAGSGQITVTGAAGVTINTSSTTKTYTQFSVISMKQVATDTYTLFGDTASF